jgi:fructan beta-fructosidase
VLPGENLLKNINADGLEIITRVEVNPQVTSFGFKLRSGTDEQTLVRYDVQKQELTVDRRSSGAVDFHEAFASVQTVKLRPIENTIELHILLDRCSVEVFANDGETVISDLIFPSASSMGLELFTEGSELMVTQLDVYQLTPAVFAS